MRDDDPGLWTYLARVVHVVDGDTLDVVVDLGLGHRAFPRLRLRGIDTYGRYLADVKYLPTEADPAAILAQGTYLNGRLLREKLATRYLE